MQLEYFTEEAYAKLLHDIPSNTKHYSEKGEWLSTYFSSMKVYHKTFPIEVDEFIPSFTPGKKDDNQKSQEDLTNTINLHSAFRNLNPYLASNTYLWTYLCHAVPEYWSYIQDRWMQDIRENTIRIRFFVTTPGSLLNDNALSRLWWYGHLTYDNQNENPYELTEILLTNQTICTDVMDTLNRMNPTRMKGVLLAIRDFKNTIADDEGIIEYFRECKKYLNHYAAVTVMDFLDVDEIRELAFNYMIRLREEKNN